MDKLKIGILFGGCGEEHPISLKSAREVAKNLDTERYEPIYIGITKEGAWRLYKGPASGWENGPTAIISPDRGMRGLLILEQGSCRPVKLDVVFPVLHGRGGEDGSIQGLLELSGIPYVGCGIQSSALCMDKSSAYALVRAAGIRTPGFQIIESGETARPCEFPVFVKPARSGSSFGVKRVDEQSGLREAIEEARRYDDKVLIEEAISGLEVGCAVMGDENGLITGEPDQITLSHGFFHIHQEENPEEGSENSFVTVPARISAETRGRVLETAKKIFRALDCRGLARVDMFLTEDGALVLNEVNTMPGFTSYSRYPRMMAAAGMPLGELIDRLVGLAMGGALNEC